MFESRNLLYLLMKQYYPVLLILGMLILGKISFLQILFAYIAICLFYRIRKNAKLNFHSSNSIFSKVFSLCPSISSLDYKPPFFLPFAPLQFLFLKKSRVIPNYKMKLEKEKIGDDGVSVDWVTYEDYEKKGNPKKIFILLPGITGNITDTYVMNTVDKAILEGYTVGIYQMRILSENVKFPQEKGVHFSLFEDVNMAFNYIKNKFGSDSQIYAVGYSYGANQLIRYLGEYNTKNRIITAAVSISNPYDFSIVGSEVENTIYERMILYFTQRSFKRIRKSIEKDKKYNINCDIVQNTHSEREYDTEFSIKIFGYSSSSEFYRNIGCARFLKYIDIPLLCIHSKDDSVTDFRCVPLDDFNLNKNIAYIITDQGNHSCFLENNGIFGVKQWIVKPAIEFINAIDTIVN